MERNNNYSFHNYHTDYYNQTPQENTQHAAQPEVGQTSGASTASEQVKVQFLAGLENYAQGALLEDCSTTLNFRHYVTNHGRLTREGRALYRNLPPDQQQWADQALNSRRNDYVNRSTNNEPVELRFLAALDRHEQGVPLRENSETINFSRFIDRDGQLTSSGQAVYRRLPWGAQQHVNQALQRARVRSEERLTNHNNRVEERFLASLDNYARGLSMEECSRHISIDRYVTDDGHLQPRRGESLYNRLSDDDKYRVDQALTARREVRGNRSTYLQQREVAGNHPTYVPRR
ncbi:MAG: hypothetical protein P8X74_19800 [Reinekea sp.]